MLEEGTKQERVGLVADGVLVAAFVFECCWLEAIWWELVGGELVDCQLGKIGVVCSFFSSFG